MDKKNSAKRVRAGDLEGVEERSLERPNSDTRSTSVRPYTSSLHPAMVTSEKQQLALDMMPHEILVMIVGNLLIEQDPLELHSKRRFNKTKRVKISSNAKSWTPLISVLLACRAMYFAGLEVFYERNVLKFHQALHLHKFVSGLSYDQRWAVRTIELHLQWTKPRRGMDWSLLHQSDFCSDWKDVLCRLPRLKRITLKSYSRLDELGMMDCVDVVAFERRTRDEVGPRLASMLMFVWPAGKAAL